MGLNFVDSDQCVVVVDCKKIVVQTERQDAVLLLYPVVFSPFEHISRPIYDQVSTIIAYNNVVFLCRLKCLNGVGSVGIRLFVGVNVSEYGFLIEVVDADLVFVAVGDERVGEEVES